ncbi:MAG TPA: MurR/RpiR family transcriptional regulator [Acetobacteraceae bacterium]|nr:MurR/RpiR family transcriptional regulator [Acetobacteraceae bacterium]
MTLDESATISERIRLGLGRLTPTERKVAHILLANYPVAGLETVSEFACRAQVSAPTVLRFVSRLGFASYPDFQRALRSELEQQVQSPLVKARFSLESTTPTGQLLNRFHQSLADNLAKTFRSVPSAEFDAVVDIFSDRRRKVLTIGGRFSDALALYLSFHLRIIRSGVSHIGGQSANWRDHLLDLGERDCLVIFDIRRYAPDLAELAAIASDRRVGIVLFTDQWLSPIAQKAAHILAAHVPVPSRWDSMVALLALVEAVVASTTERLWSTAESRLAALETMRHVPRGG